MSDLYDDMDQAAAQAGGNVLPDPLTDIKVRQDQIARRRRMAEELTAQAMQTGGQMVGPVYVGKSPWLSLAQGLGGGIMQHMTDKDATELELQQRMQQSDWSKRYQSAPDDQTRQGLLTEARDRGLRYDLEQQFAKDEANRIERGEQLAADRVAKAENTREAEAARARDRKDQREWQEQQNALYRRTAEQQMVRQGGANADLDRQIKEMRLEQMRNPTPKPVNLTPAQQKAVDDSDALLGYIDSAMEGVKTNPDAVGFKTVIPDMALSKIDPGGVQTRAAVAGLSAERVHQLSGAAVSPAEFARLRPYLPASGDTADAVQKKLTNLRAEVERIRESHMKGPTRAQPQQPGAPKVVRTGVLNGRKVEQLSDGTTRYAN